VIHTQSLSLEIKELSEAAELILGVTELSQSTGIADQVFRSSKAKTPGEKTKVVIINLSTNTKGQAMKVSLEELNDLSSAIAPLDTIEMRAKYLSGDYPRANTTKDLWQRYRWDLYWACGYKLDNDKYADAHIDTALRNAVPNLK